MLARTLLTSAALTCAAAAAAPAAHADLEFRDFTSSIDVVHEIRGPGVENTLKLKMDKDFLSVSIYRGEGSPPPIQTDSTGDKRPGTLTGKGCGTKKVGTPLRLSVEGHWKKPNVSKLVLNSGSISALRGFCGGPKDFDHTVLPTTTFKGGVKVLRTLRPGQARTLKAVERQGDCSEVCTVTRATLRLSRQD